MEHKQAYRRARIPKRFWDKGLEDYRVEGGIGDPEALARVTEYVDNLEENAENGVGFTLVGEPGGGKTMLGCAVLRIALAEGYTAEFRTLSSYIQLLQNQIEFSRICASPMAEPSDFDDYEAIRAEIDSLVNEYDFVFIDDIGKEHLTSTEWAQRKFDYLVRHRFDKGLVTLQSSNVEIRKWANSYGAAMASFIHEACPVIAVSPEKDYRRQM